MCLYGLKLPDAGCVIEPRAVPDVTYADEVALLKLNDANQLTAVTWCHVGNPHTVSHVVDSCIRQSLWCLGHPLHVYLLA